MLPKRRATRRRFSCLAFSLALAACLLSAADAPARQKKGETRKGLPTTGRVEVLTNPGGFPIFIDGRPADKTADYVRTIELEPGPHTVEIIFPNNDRWTHTLNIVAGRKFCIALEYRPRTISIPALASSPCPYPVMVTAPATVNDGDILTFSADVGYSGGSQLKYTWTVSPPAARILYGQGTPTIAVDSSRLGGRRVTATLVVDDGSGDRNCRQTAQAATTVNALTNPPAAPPLPDESRPETPGGGVEREVRPAVAEGAGAHASAAPTNTTAPSRDAVQDEVIELGEVKGNVCDCGEIPVSAAAQEVDTVRPDLSNSPSANRRNAAWRKRAAAR